MSFTVGEAASLHTLLRWLLPKTNTVRVPVTDDQARDALAHLAGRARKSLLAGPSADEVHAAWPPPRLIRTCRVCGCTDDDCTKCVEAYGEPCTWAERDLCSHCTHDARGATS